jgi:hypothetical protein
MLLEDITSFIAVPYADHGSISRLTSSIPFSIFAQDFDDAKVRAMSNPASLRSNLPVIVLGLSFISIE